MQGLAGAALSAGADVAEGADVVIAARRRVVGGLATALSITGFGRAAVAVIAGAGGRGRAGALDARIARGAVVVVVTCRGIAGELAALDGVTAVVRARVAIVARKGAAAHADARLADIDHGTQVAVRAGEIVGDEGAALFGLAAIGRAQVAVIADCGGAGQAYAFAAQIADGTDAVVAAAGRVVGHGGAAFDGVATVGRAWVAVVANY